MDGPRMTASSSLQPYVHHIQVEHVNDSVSKWQTHPEWIPDRLDIGWYTDDRIRAARMQPSMAIAPSQPSGGDVDVPEIKDAEKHGTSYVKREPAEEMERGRQLKPRRPFRVPVAEVVGMVHMPVRQRVLRRIGVPIDRASVAAGPQIAGGMNDNRTGARSRKQVCRTCGGEVCSCLLHLGGIELPERILLKDNRPTVLNLQRTVCFYCARPLIAKSSPRFVELASRSVYDRLKMCVSMCRRVTYCGCVPGAKTKAKMITPTATDANNKKKRGRKKSISLVVESKETATNAAVPGVSNVKRTGTSSSVTKQKAPARSSKRQRKRRTSSKRSLRTRKDDVSEEEEEDDPSGSGSNLDNADPQYDDDEEEEDDDEEEEGAGASVIGAKTRDDKRKLLMKRIAETNRRMENMSKRSLQRKESALRQRRRQHREIDDGIDTFEEDEHTLAEKAMEDEAQAAVGVHDDEDDEEKEDAPDDESDEKRRKTKKHRKSDHDGHGPRHSDSDREDTDDTRDSGRHNKRHRGDDYERSYEKHANSEEDDDDRNEGGGDEEDDSTDPEAEDAQGGINRKRKHPSKNTAGTSRRRHEGAASRRNTDSEQSEDEHHHATRAHRKEHKRRQSATYGDDSTSGRHTSQGDDDHNSSHSASNSEGEDRDSESGAGHRATLTDSSGSDDHGDKDTSDDRRSSSEEEDTRRSYRRRRDTSVDSVNSTSSSHSNATNHDDDEKGKSIATTTTPVSDEEDDEQERDHEDQSTPHLKEASEDDGMDMKEEDASVRETKVKLLRGPLEQEPDDMVFSGPCGQPQPVLKALRLSIQATFTDPRTGAERVEIVDNEKLYSVLSQIPDEWLLFLGFDPQWTHPKNLITSHLPYVPERSVEQHEDNNQWLYTSRTRELRSVIRTSRNLKIHMGWKPSCVMRIGGKWQIVDEMGGIGDAKTGRQGGTGTLGMYGSSSITTSSSGAGGSDGRPVLSNNNNPITNLRRNIPPIRASDPQLWIDTQRQMVVDLEYAVNNTLKRDTNTSMRNGVTIAAHGAEPMSMNMRRTQNSGASSKSQSQKFQGKQGFCRLIVDGKKVFFTFRGVLAVAHDLPAGVIMVPDWLMMAHTESDVVTELNAHELRECVRNGPDIYPGANVIIDSKGKRYDLRYVNNRSIIIQYGWTVERHLNTANFNRLEGVLRHSGFAKGSRIHANRQPSLAGPSWNGHQVCTYSAPLTRFTSEEEIFATILMNHWAFEAYHADCDGDEMNLHTMRLVGEKAESDELAELNHHSRLARDGSVTFPATQDDVLALWTMTEPGRVYNYHEALQHLSIIGYSYRHHLHGDACASSSCSRTTDGGYDRPMAAPSPSSSSSLMETQETIQPVPINCTKNGDHSRAALPVSCWRLERIHMQSPPVQYPDYYVEGEETDQTDNDDDDDEQNDVVALASDDQDCDADDAETMDDLEAEMTTTKRSRRRQTSGSGKPVLHAKETIRFCMRAYVTGTDILSAVMPTKLSMTDSHGTPTIPKTVHPSVHDCGFSVQSGRMMYGRLDKDKANMILTSCISDIGNNAIGQFIYHLSQLTRSILSHSTYTYGIAECRNPIANATNEMMSGLLKWANSKDASKLSESQLQDILDKASSVLFQKHLGEALIIEQLVHRTRNGAFEMWRSGAKGDGTHICKAVVALGSTYTNGHRFQTTSARMTGLCKAREGGFIAQSLVAGMGPTANKQSMEAAREAVQLMGSSIADAGHKGRQEVSPLENVHISHGGTVITSNGVRSDSLYGGDGFSAAAITLVQYRPLNSTNIELANRHRFSDSEWNQWCRRGDTNMTRHDTLAAAHEWAQLQSDRDTSRRLKLATTLTPQSETWSDLYYSPIVFHNLIQQVDALVATTTARRSSCTSSASLCAEDCGSSPMCIAEVVTWVRSCYEALAKRHHFEHHGHAFCWMIRDWLSAKQVLTVYGWSRTQLLYALQLIEVRCAQAVVVPGSNVGLESAHSISQMLLQSGFDAFHSTGAKSNNMNQRLKHLNDLTNSVQCAEPTMTFSLRLAEKEGDVDWNTRERADALASILPVVTVKDLVRETMVLMEPLFEQQDHQQTIYDTIVGDASERRMVKWFNRQLISSCALWNGASSNFNSTLSFVEEEDEEDDEEEDKEDLAAAVSRKKSTTRSRHIRTISRTKKDDDEEDDDISDMEHESRYSAISDSYSPFVVRLVINRDECVRRNITPADIMHRIREEWDTTARRSEKEPNRNFYMCSAVSDPSYVIRIRMCKTTKTWNGLREWFRKRLEASTKLLLGKSGKVKKVPKSKQGMHSGHVLEPFSSSTSTMTTTTSPVTGTATATTTAASDLFTRDDEKAILLFYSGRIAQVQVCGLQDIASATVRKCKRARVNQETGGIAFYDLWVIDTEGANMEDLLNEYHDQVDISTLHTTDIRQHLAVFGIDASLQGINSSLMAAIGKVNPRHHRTLTTLMGTYSKLRGYNYSGLLDSVSGSARRRMLFERPLKVLYKTAHETAVETMEGPMENIMLGQVPEFGAATVALLHKSSALKQLPPVLADDENWLDGFHQSRRFDRRCIEREYKSTKIREWLRHVLSNVTSSSLPKTIVMKTNTNRVWMDKLIVRLPSAWNGDTQHIWDTVPLHDSFVIGALGTLPPNILALVPAPEVTLPFGTSSAPTTTTMHSPPTHVVDDTAHAMSIQPWNSTQPSPSTLGTSSPSSAPPSTVTCQYVDGPYSVQPLLPGMSTVSTQYVPIVYKRNVTDTSHPCAIVALDEPCGDDAKELEEDKCRNQSQHVAGDNEFDKGVRGWKLSSSRLLLLRNRVTLWQQKVSPIAMGDSMILNVNRGDRVPFDYTLVWTIPPTLPNHVVGQAKQSNLDFVAHERLIPGSRQPADITSSPATSLSIHIEYPWEVSIAPVFEPSSPKTRSRVEQQRLLSESHWTCRSASSTYANDLTHAEASAPRGSALPGFVFI